MKITHEFISQGNTKVQLCKVANGEWIVRTFYAGELTTNDVEPFGALWAAQSRFVALAVFVETGSHYSASTEKQKAFLAATKY